MDPESMDNERRDRGHMMYKQRSIGRHLLVAGLLLILAVVLVACGDSGAEELLSGVNKGNRALDFTLVNMAGEEVSLSDFEGEVVVVNFWATWCPPCRAEIPDLEAAYQDFRDEGLVVLGVNVQDPVHMIEPFVTEMGMSYPVVMDTTGMVMKDYRAPGLPVSLIVDRDGIIKERHVGYLSAEQLADYLEKVLSE
jgi:peroxiredoxin